VFAVILVVHRKQVANLDNIVEYFSLEIINMSTKMGMLIDNIIETDYSKNLIYFEKVDNMRRVDKRKRNHQINILDLFYDSIKK
jgi:hypothetical protein